MDAKKTLIEYQSKINEVLDEVMHKKLEEYSDVSPFITKFFEHVVEYTLRGGKRLRSALMYYTYKMYGGTQDEEIIRISSLIELMQVFLLIHDDVIDKDDTRRGGATFHKIYSDYSANQRFKDNVHFGNSMAVLAGDLACQIAYEMIGNSSFEPELKSKVISMVGKLIAEVVIGQITDVLLAEKEEYTFEQIMQVHEYKTGKYTYEIPVLTGALLAGVDDTELEKLEKMILPAGISFQVQDDILGMFGDNKKTGKPNNSDVIEGKKTLLILKAIENGNKEQKAIVNKYLGKPDLTDSEAEELKQVVIDTGSLKFSKDLTNQYAKDAKAAMQELDVDKNSEGWKFLEGIIDYVVSREK